MQKRRGTSPHLVDELTVKDRNMWKMAELSRNQTIATIRHVYAIPLAGNRKANSKSKIESIIYIECVY